MREDSCIGCLFAEEDSTSIMLDDLLEKHGMNMSHKSMRCVHPNSPYYEELVYEDVSCRQFIDAQQYFKIKDRQENIEELKDKIRRKKLGL